MAKLKATNFGSCRRHVSPCQSTLWWTNVPIWMGGYFDFDYDVLFQSFVSLTLKFVAFDFLECTIASCFFSCVFSHELNLCIFFQEIQFSIFWIQIQFTPKFNIFIFSTMIIKYTNAYKLTRSQVTG